MQVRVQRRDTGEWLNRFGTWQVGPAAALDARDRGITSGGFVGLGRPGSYAGTVYFDEVRVGAANGDLAPPVTSVAIRGLKQPLRPNTFAGPIRFSASVLDAGRIERVEFFVDGSLAARVTTAPFRHDFETLNIANGTHTLTVRAWDAAGNVGEAKSVFEVFNRNTVSRPDLARHYDHIRYAALAYNGTPIGPAEEKLLRESIDLVAPTRSLPRPN